MDDMKKMLDAFRALAEMSGVFYKALRKQGVPRKQATQITEGFLSELLQLTKFKEDI